MARPKNDLRILTARAEVGRYVRARKHLTYEGHTKSLREMAVELGMSKDAVMRHLKANPKLDDELNRTAWTDTLRRFAHAPAALDSARYARFGEFMKSHGLIDKVEPVSTYAPALP